MRPFFFLSFCVISLLSADEWVAATDDTKTTIPEAPPTKSPEQINQEINQAQSDFEIAQKMFIPWYTGPLITGSASNCPPKKLNFQPYLYLTVNYDSYDGQRHTVKTPNAYFISPAMVLQTGITDWLDVTVVPQAFFRWEKNEYGGNFADLPLQFGFQLYKETPYIPNIRVIVGELFPTGKYQDLNPERLGLDATGAGAFQTTVGFIVSKVFWWFKLHPTAIRFAANCNLPNNDVTVHDYNAYGGGIGTKGEVNVGNSYNLDLGIEVSLTQKWVIATDVAYTWSSKSLFSGTPGVTSSGGIPDNGAPSSDQLSLAPAIEYNIDDSSGFIGGVWFSVTGRHSAEFVSLVLSYTKLF